MSTLTALLLVISLHISVGSDTLCLNEGGHCQYDSLSCSGNYVSNVCSGSASRRCCVPASGSDTLCLNNGGHCQDDSYSCSGNYVSNLCSGSASRRCCVPLSGGTSNSICDNIHVVDRATWGARSPSHRTALTHPVNMFFIHHTEGNTCHDVSSCSSVLRGVQNYHMDSRGYSDIGYSFLIGGDGRVYEGRGWEVLGAHTLHYNSRGYAASFMGDFMRTLPVASALNAAKTLIQCGIDKGYIQANYDLLGHRDVGSTDCPGDRLYEEIKTWQHYNNNHI